MVNALYNLSESTLINYFNYFVSVSKLFSNLSNILAFFVCNCELIIPPHFSNCVDPIVNAELHFFKFSELIIKDLERVLRWVSVPNLRLLLISEHLGTWRLCFSGLTRKLTYISFPIEVWCHHKLFIILFIIPISWQMYIFQFIKSLLFNFLLPCAKFSRQSIFIISIVWWCVLLNLKRRVGLISKRKRRCHDITRQYALYFPSKEVDNVREAIARDGSLLFFNWIFLLSQSIYRGNIIALGSLLRYDWVAESVLWWYIELPVVLILGLCILKIHLAIRWILSVTIACLIATEIVKSDGLKISRFFPTILFEPHTLHDVFAGTIFDHGSRRQLIEPCRGQIWLMPHWWVVLLFVSMSQGWHLLCFSSWIGHLINASTSKVNIARIRFIK